MENTAENEKPKKITAAQILKKYNLTTAELDQMLGQIYETLEEQGEPSAD